MKTGPPELDRVDPEASRPRRDLRPSLAKVLERLFVIYLVATAVMIILMHILRPPYLEPFRAPSDLRRTAMIWGLPWPDVMPAYHLTLVTVLLTMIVNGVGLRRFPDAFWMRACRGSAMIGFIAAMVVLLYFALQFVVERPFTRLDQQSAAIFTAYASLLVMANVLTLLVTTPWAVPKLNVRRWRRKKASLPEGD